MKRIALAAALLPIAILIAAYYSLPHLFHAPLVNLNRELSGLSEKTVTLQEHEIRYLQGGDGEVVVLLHGIFAEKDHWVDFARELTGHYRVIVPDLPGYGKSSRLSNQAYDYASQAARLKALLDALGIERAHLAGNSMGGTIAALFAARYPERAQSLAFIGAPHGIRSPEPSEMDRLIDAGKAPLIAHNDAEFESMMALLFVERPFLPYPVLHTARSTAIASATSNRRLWEEQLKDRYLLNDYIGEWRAPTLVLWGNGDRVFNVSGAEVLRARSQNTTVQLLAGVGHLPMMEAPKESARIYAGFLERVQR